MESRLSYIKKPELFEELISSKDSFYAVIDSKVKDHMPEWIIKSAGVFWINEPETSKNLTTFSQGLEFFLDKGIDRYSVLYAIGGGATTDLAGYMAASLLRGIQWVSIPTTLLSQVDGSIGGKVGINMPQGKNLVGAFHAPQEVFICHDFLTTLPQEEWLSGKGEILKYAFLSREIHDLVLNKAEMEVIALECARFKKKIVEKDFKETGDRIYLNYGHTLGHAFESSLKISHGISVGMGIYYLNALFDLTEGIKEWEKLSIALELPLEKLKLNHYPQFNVDKFKNYLLQDKKKQNGKIKLVMVKNPGSPYVHEIDFAELISKIEGCSEFKN